MSILYICVSCLYTVLRENFYSIDLYRLRLTFVSSIPGVIYGRVRSAMIGKCCRRVLRRGKFKVCVGWLWRWRCGLCFWHYTVNGVGNSELFLMSLPRTGYRCRSIFRYPVHTRVKSSHLELQPTKNLWFSRCLEFFSRRHTVFSSRGPVSATEQCRRKNLSI